MKISEFLNKDNNNLDLARILLACLVIVGHSEAINGSGIYWIDPFHHFLKFTYAGAFAVKVFLFISGLVVTNSYLSKKSVVYFVISRLFRILPGLLFVLLVTVFIFGPIVTNLEFKEYLSQLNYFAYIRHNIVFYSDYLLPGVFVENLYPNIVNGSLWTLRYEIGCYIILPILFLFLGNRNKKYFIFPILLVFIDTLLPNRFFLGFIDNNPEKYLLPMAFAYGVFFAIFSTKIFINIYVVLVSFLVFFFLKSTIYAEILFTLASCNLVLFLSSLKYILKMKPKYDISYGVYLWGFLIQQTLFSLFGHINIIIHCLLAILFSVVLAVITFIFIEKPFMNFGKAFLNFINEKYLNSVKVI
ncbi:acyltransferase [Flavobacterium sp. WC2421]|uniref:acyltransferase family protein n=1 Tax=Flavobacterium sp. WC2421 TaxID=3234138 RepID=UPI0034668CC9